MKDCQLIKKILGVEKYSLAFTGTSNFNGRCLRVVPFQLRRCVRRSNRKCGKTWVSHSGIASGVQKMGSFFVFAWNYWNY